MELAKGALVMWCLYLVVSIDTCDSVLQTLYTT